MLRTAREMGYRTVAVFSDADTPHVGLADAAVRIDPPPAREFYLSIQVIMDAASAAGADAEPGTVEIRFNNQDIDPEKISAMCFHF